MNSINFDFKQLSVFQALIKKKNVSLVADELDMSQPSVSRILTSLRLHFGDPLFVRTKNGMEPTPCAAELAPAINDILNIYYSKLAKRREFDPQTSTRAFKIAASEIGHALVFPKLIKQFNQHNIDITLEGVPLGFHSLIEELETGIVDVAIGAFPKLYAGVHERKLFSEHYVCLVRADHPLYGDTLSLKEFEKAKHIVTSAKGLGHIHEQIEKKFYAVCPPENIQVVTHNFLACALITENSDCIATVPSSVLKTLGKFSNLRAITPPIKLPTFDVKQYWHERFHKDPANKWIRRTIKDCFD